MAETAINVLASRTTELVNDTIIILLDFHSAVQSKINEEILFFGLIGIALSTLGVITAVQKQESHFKQIATILITIICLWPVEVAHKDFNSTADRTVMSQYSGTTFTAALAPYYIQKLFELAFTRISYLITSSLPNGDFSNYGGAMNALQAISLSNSSVGYLMEGTPLYSSLVAYNSICTPYATIINNKLAKQGRSQLDTGDWYGLGLYGGAHYVGRSAFQKVHGLVSADIWPEKGPFPVGKPDQSSIDALAQFPNPQIDLVPNGIMVLSKSYWTKVSSKWLDYIYKNPNITYEGLRQADVLREERTFGGDKKVQEGNIDILNGDTGYGYGFNPDYDVVVHRELKFAPVGDGRGESAASQGNNGIDRWNRFFPGNCKDFYEIVHYSYENFYEGIKDVTAVIRDKDRIDDSALYHLQDDNLVLLEKSLDTVATSALQRLVDVQPLRVDSNSPYTALMPGGDVDQGFDILKVSTWGWGSTDGAAEAADDLAVTIFVRLENFFKALSVVISGPILISAISTGIGLLFAISPIWFVVQVAIPGADLALKGYIKVVAMLYVWILFLFLGNAVVEQFSQLVMQAHILNQSEFDIVVTKDTWGADEFNQSIRFAETDPLNNQSTALNSLDVQILGLHFLSLAVLSLASYVSYMVVQGADRGLKAINPNVSNADKGMALAGGMIMKSIAGGISNIVKNFAKNGGGSTMKPHVQMEPVVPKMSDGKGVAVSEGSLSRAGSGGAGDFAKPINPSPGGIGNGKGRGK